MREKFLVAIKRAGGDWIGVLPDWYDPQTSRPANRSCVCRYAAIRRLTQQSLRPFDPVESFRPPRQKGCMEILDQCIRLSSEHAANGHLLRRCYRVDVAFLPKYVLLASDREFGEGDKDGDGATDALALPPLCPANSRDHQSVKHRVRCADFVSGFWPNLLEARNWLQPSSL